MGAYDGVEVAELVGLLILSEIKEKVPKLNFGLYRVDGLATYKTTKGIHIDTMRQNYLSSSRPMVSTLWKTLEYTELTSWT